MFYTFFERSLNKLNKQGIVCTFSSSEELPNPY